MNNTRTINGVEHVWSIFDNAWITQQSWNETEQLRRGTMHAADIELASDQTLPPQIIYFSWCPRCGRGSTDGFLVGSRYHYYQGQRCTGRPVTLDYTLNGPVMPGGTAHSTAMSAPTKVLRDAAEIVVRLFDFSGADHLADALIYEANTDGTRQRGALLAFARALVADRRKREARNAPAPIRAEINTDRRSVPASPKASDPFEGLPNVDDSDAFGNPR